MSRARVGSTATFSDSHSAGSSNTSALPSSANIRGRYGSTSRKILPDFFLGSYEEALQTCQREAKIGCIVLVSNEHDDVAEFKRNTLTDPILVDLMHTNDFLVWGGDVRDREGWSAAQKLQVTTYPFVAFLALQPSRGSSSFNSSSNTRASASPSLTVLSRHQGRSSSSGPTSPTTLVDHITHQLLPRVSPFLERIKHSIRERELERRLREEQDRAFAESARRDREKIDALVLSEKLAEEARRAEEDRIAREKAESARREKIKAVWRHQAREALIPPEPVDGPDLIRVSFRLPDGRRLVRILRPTDTVTALYCFVDTHVVPPSSTGISTDADDEKLPTQTPGELGLKGLIELSNMDADDWWGFKLFLAYPRRDVSWNPNVRLGGVEGLDRGGQIVVEFVDKVRGDVGRQDEDGDEDGYDTEEST